VFVLHTASSAPVTKDDGHKRNVFGSENLGHLGMRELSMVDDWWEGFMKKTRMMELPI